MYLKSSKCIFDIALNILFRLQNTKRKDIWNVFRKSNTQQKCYWYWAHRLAEL